MRVMPYAPLIKKIQISSIVSYKTHFGKHSRT